VTKLDSILDKDIQNEDLDGMGFLTDIDGNNLSVKDFIRDAQLIQQG
jgi:hypothetical protein